MLEIGQQVGPYVILRKLGAGAMGVVFEAEQGPGGRRVAAKVLHREWARSDEVVRRFFNEARALGQIGNPHVVQVTDFGQAGSGEYYLVMEALTGESLGDVLAREKRLALPRALDLAAQIADGLGAAHAAGVVHRDLKPDNIFLIRRAASGPPGELVKILDFGLAKLVFDAARGPTREGMVLGTAEYMSPEQAESKKDIDHRSDIYALGILLYQMITGLLPFVGASMGDVLVKHVSRSPAPPRTIDEDIPPEVEAIILRCLAKDPDDRFQTMRDLCAALLACAGRSVSLAHPTAPRVSGIMPGSPGGRVSNEVPALPAATRTIIGTGLSSPSLSRPITAPTRRRWPHRSWWLLGGSLLALAAVLLYARRERAPVPTVRVWVTSTPPGAEVLDAESGARLGTTPLELRLPQGSAGALVLRHACCAEQRRAAPTARDSSLAVDLE